IVVVLPRDHDDRQLVLVQPVHEELALLVLDAQVDAEVLLDHGLDGLARGLHGRGRGAEEEVVLRESLALRVPRFGQETLRLVGIVRQRAGEPPGIGAVESRGQHPYAGAAMPRQTDLMRAVRSMAMANARRTRGSLNAVSPPQKAIHQVW